MKKFGKQRRTLCRSSSNRSSKCNRISRRSRRCHASSSGGPPGKRNGQYSHDERTRRADRLCAHVVPRLLLLAFYLDQRWPWRFAVAVIALFVGSFLLLLGA